MTFVKPFIWSILFVFIFGCKQNSQIKTGLEGKTLPSFDVMLMDSVTKFSMDKIPKGKPIILFYFRPDCPYCKAQTEAMIANIQLLKDMQICLITTAPFSQTKSYYEHYKLSKYVNIIGGYDYDNFFSQYFKAAYVPYIAIYDSNRRLKKVMLGTVRIKDIRIIAES